MSRPEALKTDRVYGMGRAIVRIPSGRLKDYKHVIYFLEDLGYNVAVLEDTSFKAEVDGRIYDDPEILIYKVAQARASK